MQWRKVRFKLATIMMVIALLAVVLAIIELLWNRSHEELVDPFDAIEMIGPEPVLPDRVVPKAIDPRNEFRRKFREPADWLQNGSPARD